MGQGFQRLSSGCHKIVIIPLKNEYFSPPTHIVIKMQIDINSRVSATKPNKLLINLIGNDNNEEEDEEMNEQRHVARPSKSARKPYSIGQVSSGFNSYFPRSVIFQINWDAAKYAKHVARITIPCQPCQSDVRPLLTNSLLHRRVISFKTHSTFPSIDLQMTLYRPSKCDAK